MTWEQISGDWSRFRSLVQLHWAKITDGQLDRVAGSRDQLVETIQAVYRMSRGAADRQLESWQNSQQR